MPMMKVEPRAGMDGKEKSKLFMYFTLIVIIRA